jgi:DNA-binding CsgD family transcriptional regulator
MVAQEAFGAPLAEFVKAGGLRIWCDFQNRSPADFASVEPRQYPYLCGLWREDVALGAVNPLSQLFYPQPPRLGLTRAERHLLERALLNESDAWIAESLGVSPNAIKKTWASAYERIARTAPFLVPPASASGLRGQEKRRSLLDYVRVHLEELRPYA